MSNPDVTTSDAKIVLIIERDHTFHELWQDMIDPIRFTIFSATSIDQARILFDRLDGNLAVVVVAACLTFRQKIDTVELVRDMRTKFNGPMIAISGNPSYRQTLMLAGCDCDCEKSKVPQKIKEVLGLE